MYERSPEKSDAPLHAEMSARWKALFTHPEALEAFSQLYDAYTDEYRPYSSCGRHYHNLAHIRSCLREMDGVIALLENPRAVAAAIWFHDAVYDATRADNEARSADLAERHLRAMAESELFIATVRQLILDTRHREAPATPDGQYLVDIDLSILGQPAEIYDAYDRNIRREYAHVPEADYRTGRAAVLRSFLARPSIYLTQSFRDRYELAARQNLSRSILALQSRNG